MMIYNIILPRESLIMKSLSNPLSKCKEMIGNDMKMLKNVMKLSGNF